MPSATTVVIPCYNEAVRLPKDRVLALADSGIHVLLVDDGSTDGTALVLRLLAQSRPGRVSILERPGNCGKGEAVRAGFLAALKSGSRIVAYLDADFATPVEEMIRILNELKSGSARAALGSRIAVLGAQIERRAIRHYLGRIFATFASMVLRLPVYDTQCGAKAFRASPALLAALAEPFHARWAFDVELIGRLLAAGLTQDDFLEVPLRRWVDVAGSRLRPMHFPLLGWELLRIQIALPGFRRNIGPARVLLEAPAPAIVDIREDVG
ncbi:MAG TPA: glycosyltransferase [Myxococcales bacterium]|nr:glycosyltransferase [Myxococcales bacterium]